VPQTRYLLAVALLSAAGCATQPVGEVISAGADASAFRDEVILSPEGGTRNLSVFPQAENEALDSETPLPYYYLFRDLHFDAAWQDGDFRPYNEMGRRYGEDFSARLSLRAAWRPFRWLYFSAVPEWYYGDTLDKGNPDKETVFHEALARFSLGDLWVDIGRFPMWWGPGTHGALLLSDNYRTRDTVRISNPRPVLLPGFLSKLGLLRFTTFLSDLHNGSPSAGRYLGGMRFAFNPTPRAEFALSRTFVFPVNGMYNYHTLWDVIFGTADDSGQSPADQKASLDFRYNFPGRVPVSVYTALATDDEPGNSNAQLALLAGSALYVPWGDDHVRVTAEWADTDLNGHGLDWYQPLYFVNGDCIGHHAGTDSTDFYTEIAWLKKNEMEVLRLYMDREAHGVSAAVTEILTETGIVISVGNASPWVFELRYAAQEKENAGGVAGATDRSSLVSLAVNRRL
jgi:hypothetical protein